MTNELVPRRKVPRRNRESKGQEETVVRERVMKAAHERDRKIEDTIIDQAAIAELKNAKTAEAVQSIVNVEDIRDGLIVTKDKRFLKVVEVEPINFTLLSETEKAYIIQQYSTLFRLQGVTSIQIKAVSRVADTERYLEIVKSRLAGEVNKKTKEMGKEYTRFVETLSKRGALTRKFYIILELENNDLLGRDRRYSEVLDDIEDVVRAVEGAFNKAGNNLLNSNSDVDFNENQYLAETLYRWYNPRTSLNESIGTRTKNAISKMCQELGIDKKTASIHDLPTIPIASLLSPKGIDFSDPEFIMRDGMYYGHLFVKSDGYPIEAPAGWFYTLMSGLGEGVELDIHIRKKKNRQDMINRIDIKTRSNKTAKGNGWVAKRKQEIAASSDYLANQLRNNNDYHEMFAIITITGLTKKELRRKIKSVKGQLSVDGVETLRPRFNMMRVWEATQFSNKVDNQLFNRGKQNIDTDNLAGISYIFYAFEVSDENGIMVGLNSHNASLCLLDLFNTKRYKNANMITMGTSGAGKTFLNSLIMSRMRLMGVQCFILAPLKGYEYRRMCDALGGSFIRLDSSSRHRINIMEIRHPGTSDSQLLEYMESGHEIDRFGFGESLLAKKSEQIRLFFGLLIREMSQEQETILQTAVDRVYSLKGITTDNESLFIDPNRPELGFKEMPILADIHEELKKLMEEGVDAKKLYNILKPYVEGTNQMFNGQTNVDLTNKYTVLDISNLSGDMLAIGMFICLDYVWEFIKRDYTQRKAVLTDELWRLINTHPLAANYVLEIFKTIRGYFGAALGATQELSDFYALEDGKYGKGIINNAKTKIILNLENAEIEVVRDVLGINNMEAMEISKFQTGEALLFSGGTKIPISVEASKREFELLTTDGNERQRLLQIEKARLASLQS